MADRIGLTMRSASAESYGEERDAIARDWYSFLASAVPELEWVLLPSLGAESAQYARRLGVDRLILSGGNDLGCAAVRDSSEWALLEGAEASRLPVFGVCRGLQVIQRYFGGTIAECDRGRHVATSHIVRFVHGGTGAETPQPAIEVNSFHGFAAVPGRLGSGLEVLAVAEDGTIEALRHTALPWLAVQWHPERGEPARVSDVLLLRRLFGLEAR